MTKIIVCLLFLLSCNTPNTSVQAVEQSAATATTSSVRDSIIEAAFDDTGKLITVKKSADEWKAELTKDEYYILRLKGTERAFTGDLWDNKKTGTYTCAACSLPLFQSDTKFKSGTGWPSFYTSIRKEFVVEYTDRSHGMLRTEVVCGRCDGHLGHVFNDGPEPTGLRYCINSASMDFVEE